MANSSSSAAPSALARDAPLFVAYVSLIALALLPIYFGSYASLRTPAAVLKARKAQRKSKGGDDPHDSDGDDDEDDDEEPAIAETLTSSDAYLFPVIGSCVLFGMYCVFKFLDRTWVDRILGTYFAAVGSAAVYKVVLSIAAALLGRKAWKQVRSYKVEVTKRLSDQELEEERREAEAKHKKSDDDDDDDDVEPSRIRTLVSLRLSWLHAPLLALALIPVVAFHATHHWLASNTVALALALNAISLMSLDSFLTGAIMLGGLFLYDIFWVFGTEVMVSVARNFDAGPIKILFPKNLPQVAGHYLRAHAQSQAHTTTALEGALARLPAWAQQALHMVSTAPKWQMTMLGLGDIVIPGIFIALALRFDQHLYLHPSGAKSATTTTTTTAAPAAGAARIASYSLTRTTFPKPYFHASLTAYILGLTTTMAVMHVFQAAQPALLYLSPACVGSVALLAIKRGEVKRVWDWVDAEEEEQGKDKEGKKE